MTQDWYIQALCLLLADEPFYANFLINAEVDKNSKEVPTAAAAVKAGRVKILFNEAFMLSLSVGERVAVIKHEVLHILFGHIKYPNYGIIKNEADANNWNIAMDCAINQLIGEDRLPAGCITLKSLQQFTEEQLEAKQTCEYYYAKMMNKANEMMAAGLKPGDEHMESDGSAAEIRVAAAAAASAAMAQSRGIASSELQGVLSQLNRGSQVSWQQMLRNFVARSSSSSIAYTRKKPDRRRDLDVPGKKRKRELVIGVCTDSSGSVPDKDYEAYLNEIGHLSKHVKSVFHVQADAEVKTTKKLKKGQKPDSKRDGYGGTAYGPAIEACMKAGVDAIIYFGDMDSADKPENPGVPFLWLVSGTQNPPANFGEVVRLA